jgi:hypothetical protein
MQIAALEAQPTSNYPGVDKPGATERGGLDSPPFRSPYSIFGGQLVAGHTNLVAAPD